MRWPWSDRPAVHKAAASQAALLRCDEWVEEPARIRELMTALTQQQAHLTLMGRGQRPLQARLGNQALGAALLPLRVTGPDDMLHQTVTAMTQLNGVDLIFSSQVRASSVGSWALEVPHALIYLNMRRLFRSRCAGGECLAVSAGTSRTIQADVMNLSETGACVAMSASAAHQLHETREQGEPLTGRLDLANLSVHVTAVDIRHVTPHADAAHVGISFHLAEGAERQRLRQALHQRQVEVLQKKKATCAFPN